MAALITLLGIAAGLVVTLAAVWLIGERGRPFGLPSTRAALSKNGGERGRGISLNIVHGYFYSRWPEQYIGFAIKQMLPRMSASFKKKWADHYHGKVVPLELAESIITLDHDIPRTDLEQIIPYPVARDIVLSGPPDIVVMDCPCRLNRQDPCLPLRVCMIVGDGGFVLDHRPAKANAISQQEALDLLRTEHERGHVHVAYFKDACDNRFYAICNCCSCCCGGIEAMRHASPMVTASGYVSEFSASACEACGTCAEACPFDAITVNGHAQVIYEKCMGCGVCVDRCPNDAIRLVRDPGKGIPLDVRTIGIPEAGPG